MIETMHRDLLVRRFRERDWQLLGEGRLLLEQRTFDPASGVAQTTQTLIESTRERDSHSFSVRVYTATELVAMLMRAGLSGRQVLAVLVAFAVGYAAVGLIGARHKLPDWALFAPWITLLGLQHFIIRGLALHLRHRRWRASKVVVKLPASVAAAHSYARQRKARREAA